MSDGVSKEQALAELRTADPSARQDALLILSEHPEPDVTEALLEVLPEVDTSQPGEGYTVAQIIDELRTRGERRLIPHVLEILERDLDNGDDHQIQETACRAFEALDAREALPFLREALFAPGWEYLESEVAETLGRVGGAREVDTLSRALEAPSQRLKLAALGGLRATGASEAIPVVARIAESSEDEELRIAARLTLAALEPERAEEHVQLALDEATEPAQRAAIYRAIRAIEQPDLSPHLLPLVDDGVSPHLRFGILALLAERGHPEGFERLQALRADDGAGPWVRVHAGALLLRARYDEELARDLTSTLASLRYLRDEHGPLNQVNDAGNAALHALVDATREHPARFLETVRLLDDLRRERIQSYPRARFVAHELIEQVVGSARYRDLDRWVADHRETHGLAAETATTESDAPKTPGKRPWWKLW